MQFKTLRQVTLLLAAAGMTSTMYASEMASATLTSTQIDPTEWLYSVQLDDIGTTNLGTFWFSWIPGEDFMNSTASDVTTPAGWTDTITNGGGSDGYAIRWVAGAGDAVTSGNTLSGFSFESSVSPSTLTGNSPFYPAEPELTAFVYSGGPFSDAGYSFVVQETAAAGTPEPASAGLVVVGAFALVVYVRRRSARRVA